MDINPEAYKKDPEWQRLDKSARRWRKAFYVILTVTLLLTVTYWTLRLIGG